MIGGYQAAVTATVRVDWMNLGWFNACSLVKIPIEDKSSCAQYLLAYLFCVVVKCGA